MDEKGFMIGMVQEAQRVFSLKLFKQGKLKGAGQDGNRSWITFIAGVCADGTALPPAIIFAGTGDVQSSWVQDFDTTKHECYFTSTPSGWTNEELGFHWLTRVFDKATKTKAGNGWRLLWVDGHGSHLNMRFIDWAIKQKILIAVYPPHSTHRLQPLDVSLFGPLSTYYSQNLDQWILKTQGTVGINQSHFLSLFWPAFERAFTKKNIKNSWARTGLDPFKPSVVLDQLDKFTERPGSSSSNSSIFSVSDWRKLRRIVKTEISKAVNNTLLLGMEKLVAENELLKFKLHAAEETIKAQKKKGQKSKPLWEQIRKEGESKALFLSPAKVQLAHQKIKEKEDQEAAELARKKQQVIDKAVIKQLKEQQLQERKVAREEARKLKTQEQAEKRAQREAQLLQNQVDKQLTSEVKSTQKRARNKVKQSGQPKVKDSVSTAIADEMAVVGRQTRAGRKIKTPKHLQE
jgi:DDE superfamily endonuclease